MRRSTPNDLRKIQFHRGNPETTERNKDQSAGIVKEDQNQKSGQEPDDVNNSADERPTSEEAKNSPPEDNKDNTSSQ